jgi:hypothetical protein
MIKVVEPNQNSKILISIVLLLNEDVSSPAVLTQYCPFLTFRIRLLSEKQA